MSNLHSIVERLRLLARSRELNIPDSKLGDIAEALQRLDKIATRSNVKTAIAVRDYLLKQAIDTGDVDFWIDQIVGILNDK